MAITTYLDNAATSFPKPEAVYAALDRCARTQLANPGRAGHKMALASERLLDDGRHRLNQLFRGDGPERFIFTLNCTDALNIAFKGVLQSGDHGKSWNCTKYKPKETKIAFTCRKGSKDYYAIRK